MSRPLTPAGHRILGAAEDLFYHHGITAVGVDLIAERAGVTKRTLYNQFGSKDQLVASYLTARDARWREFVLRAVESSADPVDAVTAPFEALRTWTRTNDRGCAFINALAELPDPSLPAHGVATGQKRWLVRLFTERAAAAGCAEPATLAARLFVLHEGVLATQPLPFDTLTETTDLARSLVRGSIPSDAPDVER